MDFSFSEEQDALRRLAREILEKEVSSERLTAVESSPEWFDRELWSHLAEANLLGLAIPEPQGGMGFGICELAVLLEELGRTVAPIPALPTLVLGALPIAEFGTEDQKQRWLPSVAAGELVLSGALVDADSGDPALPATRAQPDAEDWLLEGRKLHVPAADLADRILVPAATGRGVGLFLVDPAATGVTLVRREITTGEPLFELILDGVRVPGSELIGGDALEGAGHATWIYVCGLAATCALQIGVSERTLEMTSQYAKEREQFGVPIGSFQAVQHRLADCFADLEAMRWSNWRAVWRIAEGLPAQRQAAVAKFWAAEAGSSIGNAAMHLHGGIGVDMDYPLQRYFVWSKSLELNLGSAAPQLAWLGRDMARTGPEELR